LNKLNKFTPYLIFLAVTLTLFGGFVFSNEVLFSSDQLESGIFFRKFYSEFVKEFWVIPLWDRYISCGLPFVDAMHGDTFYPAAAMQFFIPLHKALGLKLVLHVFLSGVFMFVFLKNYGLRKFSAFAGSIAYMTAPMIVTLVYPGHDAKMYVAALLPLAFNFLYKGLEGKGKRNYMFFGGVAGFMILSSHIQTTYFALWLFFFYALFRIVSEFISNRSLKPAAFNFSMFWAGIALMAAIGAIQLIPPYIYSKEFSIRGTGAKTSYEHAITWGMHPEEAVSLIVPEFCGENRMSHYVGVETQEEYDKYTNELKNGGNSYWGRNPFKLNSEYSGIVIIVFSIMALFLYRGRHRKDVIFFLSFGLFTLLYSLVDHTPLFRLVYTLIPGVKMFRGQSMILFLLTFSLSVAASIFIDYLTTVKEEGKGRKLAGILFITATVIFSAGLIKSFALNGVLDIYRSIFDPPKMPSSEYLPVIRNGIILTIFFAAGSLAAAGLYLRNKIGSFAFIAVLSLMLFADTYRVNSKFIKTVEKDRLGIKFTDIEITKQIRSLEQKEGHFRVFDINMYGANQLPIHYVSTVTGFHDNELKWYRKFRGINDEGVNTDENLTKNLNQFYENNFLSLAGARFLFFKPKEGDAQVLPNPNYMPRAFVVSDYEVITDEDAIVAKLGSDLDVRSKVILEKDPGLEMTLDSLSAGRIISYKYEGNEVFLEAEMYKNGIVVITDNYFPYWHAFDENDKEIKIFKANLTFRALALEKGTHKIRFEYISKPFFYGKILTIIGLIFLSVVVIFPHFMKNKGNSNKKKEVNNDQ
jgi:hypothetical protein